MELKFLIIKLANAVRELNERLKSDYTAIELRVDNECDVDFHFYYAKGEASTRHCFNLKNNTPSITFDSVVEELKTEGVKNAIIDLSYDIGEKEEELANLKSRLAELKKEAEDER